jgi:subtilisin family serine protease
MMRRFTFLLRLGLTLGAVGIALVGGHAQAQNAPPHVPGRILVQFNPRVTAEQVRSLVAAGNTRDAGEIPHTGVHVLQLPPQASEVAMARAFAARPEVSFAELDVVMRPAQAGSVTPNDSYCPYEWHLTKISAPTAWATSTGSSAVVIAILDTGCDPTHPDLQPKYVPGWNFYDNNSNTSDVFGHGTAVAGQAAACTNNGTGVASVAWGCKIMPIRISDTSGIASFSTAASALTWAADHGARVANLSYQMSDSSAIASAAQYMESKGGVTTIAAGNNGTFDTTTDNPYVLTVSATDSTDTICSWSNTGNNVDISAPGSGIYTTTNGGGYGSGTGTSASAPIVAGVAALVLSVNPNLTGVQTRSLIEQSVDLVGGATGWTPQYGYGRVNAAKAVSLALAGGTADTMPPTISITSPANGATVAGTISIQASASDNVGVNSVAFYLDSAMTPFATVTASPYSASWNSTTVANGSHTITATAKDAAGNSASASISLTVSNAVNRAPTVATAAAASANPVTGTTVTLTVLGADDGSEANLTYTWTAAGPAAVTFSANGTNAAKSTTATFAQAGAYSFTVTLKDAGGLTMNSAVSVTVSQTATTVAVSPGSATAAVNSPKQFSRTVKDQFGTALSAQPACTWTVSGGGTIDATGLFMAGSIAGGPFNVMATAGVMGMATVTITPPADTNPPTALITSPYGGNISGNITVTVGVSDDVGVVKVELWVDGKLTATDTASPWSFNLNTNKWKSGSSHTLLAKAYDAAGNVGTSGIVTVSK